MKKMIPLTFLVLATSGVNATDLSTIYQQAASNDAEIAAARASREANGYNVDIARGAILPQAQASYSVTRYDVEGESASVANYILNGDSSPQSYSSDYVMQQFQVSASQALFNLNSWYTYKAAASVDDAYAAQLQLSEQNLLLRTAQAYFDVLRAAENLATAEAEEKAVKQSLEQTRQRYEVGLIAITDVQEAQATYDLTYVNLLSQQAALDVSYEALETLTGQRYDDLASLRQNVAMQMPMPADVQQWVDSGLDKYAGIQMAEAQKDAARLQRDATRSNHLPTVTLSAAYTRGDSAPSLNSYPTDANSKTIGLNVSVPLFTGGSLYAQTKQSASNLAVADYQLESQRRSVKQNVRSLYRQLQTSVQNIDARRQSITSAETALKATQTGYEVGTRNIVEVLDAQRQLFSAQSNYANARFDYIINLLNLKFYAGTLNEQDIQLLNSWLES
ncbi:TolC family outer membrane protein [Oceanobacter mangrovi]|uniref:TolC family outer membrane protein n=1 Tax=Oceanobacter mangrovi TaxID=2862510 RepID=UPI001C8D2234|nr:TolC family outer membrane protein [Oceanobacter mangrovi]